MTVACSFEQRRRVATRQLGVFQPAETAVYHYEPISFPGWHADGRWHTDHPPAVGDLVALPGHTRPFRVVAMQWMPAAYGSPDWSHGPVPSSDLWLTLIVEAAEGLYADEAERPPEDG